MKKSQRVSVFRAYAQRGEGGASTFDDRNYVQLQSNVQWYLTPSFIAEVSYRYTVSDRSEAIGERLEFEPDQSLVRLSAANTSRQVDRERNRGR